MTDYSAKIAALEEAIGSGELTIESDGERVTYRSMDDLMKAHRFFVGQQASATPTGASTMSSLAIYSGD